ncbi:unnamed protein product [Echinostoma caproni]|uniref:14_3_3 domain-containing protein n=1 Tax=Echinostoma caproni TaxID=27848 RepID=A0A183A8J7_9TREM|nr:unnamed protein product [Echinostoma caproni]
MISYLESLKNCDAEFTLEEQNLSAAAYKNLIDPLRYSLKVITSEVVKAEEENSPYLEYDKLFENQVKTELRNLVQQAMDHLDDNLTIPHSKVEAEVFCLKLKADYYRYLAELEEGSNRENVAEYSLIAYKQANSIATSSLPPNNPLRLGVALNFATFYHSIAGKTDMAFKIARQAYTDAVAEMDETNEEKNSDSSLIMQVLKINIACWSKELPLGN